MRHGASRAGNKNRNGTAVIVDIVDVLPIIFLHTLTFRSTRHDGPGRDVTLVSIGFTAGNIVINITVQLSRGERISILVDFIRIRNTKTNTSLALNMTISLSYDMSCIMRTN